MKNPFSRKKPAPEAPAALGTAANPMPYAKARPFKLSAEEIVDLGVPRSGCLATNRIVIDGAPIAFAQRDRDRVAPEDSGWRFFAGDEDDAYMDDVDNHGVYSLNTIANYDRIIIPILDAPPGTAWVREGDALIPDPMGYTENRD
ncbi:hypothetical protein GCM10025867_47930 (plasmid) [Frondihabitans sucicola]|uniref:Immunity protein Imm33 domain-containing protein n=1 Tax=Frondihabitans sucicola TaxID=1268041 RepID=A0ABN6Y5E1_9MICO|nr:DUF2185 domain-containing protein [Frondihabitans sucicola]BDZ52552.1 hypothetical protein GCM10025867_47930 [Frondihabitans sucicola]